MFNLSDNSAARYQRYLVRLMANFESSSAKRMYPILQQAYDNAAGLLLHGQDDFDIMIEDHRKTVKVQLDKEYRNLTAYFGTFAFDHFKKEYKKSLAIPYIKGMEDVYWEQIKQWSNISVLYKAKEISKTTNKLIQILIRRGMEDGLSNNEIVKQLKEERKTFNKVRAIRIVRTETHSAANKAIDTAVQSTGYNHDRIWRATLDDRVRGRDFKDRFDHLRANGQRRDMDIPFDVSNEKLDYPGDPKASAGNVINCRCVLTYSTKKT